MAWGSMEQEVWQKEEEGMFWNIINGVRNIGQLINSALEPNIYLTRCYCCVWRSNKNWEVFTVFDNYLIQVLCGPLILIKRPSSLKSINYQSAPFHCLWQIHATSCFKVCSPHGQTFISDLGKATSPQLFCIVEMTCIFGT